jgi:acyl-CoA synthetase (AMP-forming)/AMP-acid ligase II
MPRVVEVGGGPVPDAVFRTFAARFGVPARPAYGSTECGTITTDTAPAEACRPIAVGRALPGVGLRIGSDPRDPLPVGVPGQIWARTPWQMAGYGYPPDVRPGPAIEGWSATEDVGFLDDEGYLTLLGRMDECFKTVAGYLVSPLAIVEALLRHPAVRDAIAVPLSTGRGALIGALVEGDDRLDPDEVRRHAAEVLPPWSRPHVVVVSAELPRLPGGKVDRHASRRRLDAAGARGE